jgi:mRNA interferase MazF
VVAERRRAPCRDEVWLVALDPTVGSEIQKTRPCIVISPDEANVYLRTVIIAPLTSTLRAYPTRVPVTFKGKSGEVALDQIRSVDRSRLVSRLGALERETGLRIARGLVEMFERSETELGPA